LVDKGSRHEYVIHIQDENDILQVILWPFKNPTFAYYVIKCVLSM
jgi:hypothetical protein